MTDFSWAIILACLKQFCNESVCEYLNRTYRIVQGEGRSEDFQKTQNLHVYSVHIMKLNQKWSRLKLGQSSPFCNEILWLLTKLYCSYRSCRAGEKSTNSNE